MKNEILNNLLDLAVAREVEAAVFYTNISKSSDNPIIKKIFEDLANEEEQHRDLIMELKQQEKDFKFSAPPDYKLAEETELPPLSMDMKPADAFNLAMQKERQAADFYLKLANLTHNSEIRELCLNLSNMELIHKKKIERAYIDVAYIESF